MKITRGKVNAAKKVLIYGPEGIGKSTFASKFPDSLFIDVERGTYNLDVARCDPLPTSWTMIKENVRYVVQNPDICKTLIIDSADWAEKMCVQSVCDEHQWRNITDPGYGNGYSHVFTEFGQLLNLLNEVLQKGINVVFTAHAALRKFEQPDELGAYDRWALKLIDTPKCSIARLLMEWADMVLFANYKTIVITDSKTKKSKAQGGQRVMYTTHHSCWDAKNRYNLPEELSFIYDAIREVIEGPISETAASAQPRMTAVQPASPAPEEIPSPKSKSSAPAAQEASPAVSGRDAPVAAKTQTQEQLMQEKPIEEKDLSLKIPKALRDLMLHDNIGEWDIETFAISKGFVPFGTEIADFERVNPGIIEGLFVAQWTKVRDQIREARKKQEIPFN